MATGANRAVVLVAVSVTLMSVVALGQLWLTGSTATAAGQVATMDGLTVEVLGAEWAAMDHVEDGRGGFLMPDQMMPGAPTGNQVRLGVKVTLSNTQARTSQFSLVDEFTVTGGLGPEPLPLAADTVGHLNRLGPGTAVNATLYFDVETAADEDLPPLYLTWSRGRDTILIQVPVPGEAPPAHDH